MKTEGKPVWVSRDRESIYVDFWKRKPRWNAENQEYEVKDLADGLASLCLKHFKARTGLHLKPGQCLKIKLTAEVLEGNDEPNT